MGMPETYGTVIRGTKNFVTKSLGEEVKQRVRMSLFYTFSNLSSPGYVKFHAKQTGKYKTVFPMSIH